MINMFSANMQDLVSCDRESANTENRNSEIWNNYCIWQKKNRL